MKKYRAGVLYGEELAALYQDAKDNGFALPAVNTIGTNSINATLEAAAKVNSPVIIQFSNGGAQFIAGKAMPNDHLQANIAGAISGALHVHNVAKYYGVPVVLHTDHAAHKWLPWISGLIEAGEQYFKEKGQPLFSSHMLDLSEEPIAENIQTSVQFYQRMAPLGMGIEIELALVDSNTMALSNSIEQVLPKIPEQLTGSIKPELMQSYVEINSGVCHTIDEAESDLRQKLVVLERITDELGLRLYWSGTHPFSHWRDQRATCRLT